MTSKLKVNILADGGDNAIMTSNGSGTLTLNNAALKNTPNFNAVMDVADQTISNNTWTKIGFGDEQWDSDGKYDASNDRFTPTVAGKYWYKISVVVDDGNASSIQAVTIFKNGTQSSLNGYSTRSWSVSGGGVNTIETSGTIDLDGDDYIEAYVYLETATNIYNQFGTNKGVSQFTSYRLIGT